MPAISVFEIFKIGVGPSSSHTIGPWKAASRFLLSLEGLAFDRLEVHLFGSLSKTGRGHATDAAVQLGLMGYDPVTVDTGSIPEILAELQENKILTIGERFLPFDPERDILFTNVNRKSHPNTLEFLAYFQEEVVKVGTYASVGGGFIKEVGVRPKGKRVKFPHPIEKGRDILGYTDELNKSIAEIVFDNELSLRPAAEVRQKLQEIIDVMKKSVYRGCITEGVLPGGLNVRRRAKGICDDLLEHRPFSNQAEWEAGVRSTTADFRTINKWISCFALAVNEENAAMGRIVTSPTNGAAGVVPAVLLYYYFFCDPEPNFGVDDFLLVAGEIGCLFKKGATISAAVGGCQAEIGVSSAMAAGALTQVQGGSPRQVLMAAEIAMEHHLGLTCDPVGGLVQIPCIERNAMGAMKAITAANLALAGDPEHSKVDIDTVIKTMWDTAKAMNSKYKETSEGGLAFNLPVVLPEC
ncbi:L-serine dehydratase [Neolewinella agarilytica]|uniref:L-serine dehydratase n=1 Tax=Neolewinella agarilytica TaxID=478744 RepID=A0A1H8ZU58_9BACT|nr:L-serine ammonia-lyase [Neolewinella agarilytica]SEP67989.1 L-serine dehydratase [Neolewinella agarilytica]